jgi:hypothetical protein
VVDNSLADRDAEIVSGVPSAVRIHWSPFSLAIALTAVLPLSSALADTQMFKQDEAAKAYAIQLQNSVKNSLWRYVGNLSYSKSSTCSIVRPDSELFLQFDSQGDGFVEGKSYGRIGPSKANFDHKEAKRLYRKSAAVQAETACRSNEDPGSDWDADASLQITIISAGEGSMVSTQLFRRTAEGRSRYDVKFLDNNSKMRLRVVDIGAERIFEKVK